MPIEPILDFDDGIRLDVDEEDIVIVALLDKDEDDLGDSRRLELSRWGWLLRYSSAEAVTAAVPLDVVVVSDADEDDDDVGDDKSDEDDGELDLWDLCDLVAKLYTKKKSVTMRE